MSALIRLGESLFPYILDAAWKATALMLIVLALSLVLGRRRLTARYWLWVYCLVGILILPLTSFVARGHRVALLRIKSPAAVSPAISIVSGEGATVIGRSPTEEPATEDRPLPPGQPGGFPEAAARENVTSDSPAVKVIASEDSGGARTAAAQVSQAKVMRLSDKAGAPSSFPWRGAIGLAWLAGFAFCLVRLVFAAICVARLRRASSVVSNPDIADLFETAKKSVGVGKGTELRITSNLPSPVSVGILRPTILLPQSLASEMPPEQLRPIFLHELAHVRWRDHAINALQRFVQALFFFHPFVYPMNRHLRRVREEICDNWVLERFSEATLYARALTTLAERWFRPSRALIGVGLFNHHSRLSDRIRRIVSGSRSSTRIRLRTAFALLVISLLSVAALSLTTLAAKTAKPDEKASREEKRATPVTQSPVEGNVISWKEEAVYRDGKPYAKIVQWEPEADLPMVAFGDQNNNGKTDTWIRFLNGKPLRIEIDSNEDGRIDEWEHYFDGVIDLVEVDTDFNRKVDLWQVYDKGKLFREEIDLNADGSVDKWVEVDDQGKLVEKEIFSWVVEKWLRTELARQVGERDPRAYASATLFNAKDRVQEVEEKPTVPEPSAAAAPGPVPVPGSPPRTARPPSPYVASTGSRIEYTKEVDGARVVSAWFHQSVSGGDPPPRQAVSGGDPPPRQQEQAPLYPSPAYEGVRYMAYDRGFDGGVDSWDQVGPAIPEEARRSQYGQRVLFRALFEDKNRDGKAETCQVKLASDAPSRQVPVEKLQTRCRDDGVLDMYVVEIGLGYLRTSLRDFNGDGVLDSFGPEVRFPSYVEPVGSSVAQLQLKLTGGEEPPPMLSKLQMERGPDGEGLGRAFWLVPGEQATLRKLSRGVYNLTIRVGGDEHREATTFSYPSFLALDKGQTLSKVLNWDSRPVFRGKLLDAAAQPRGYRQLTLSAPGRSALSITLHTDPAGDFEVFNAPPGQYALSVGQIGFTQTIDVPAPSDQAPERQLVLSTLSPEARTGPRPPSPPGEEKAPTWEAPLALFGKVLSHEGEALPNMKLVVSQVKGKGEGAGITRTAVTGLDGSYRVLILPPGRYSVSIHNNDFPDQKPVEEFSVEIGTVPLQKDFRLSAPLPATSE